MHQRDGAETLNTASGDDGDMPPAAALARGASGGEAELLHVELEALRSQLSSAQRASQQLERELQELQLALEQQKAATAASQAALSEARESAAAAAAAAEEQGIAAEQADASVAELRSHYEGEWAASCLQDASTHECMMQLAAWWCVEGFFWWCGSDAGNNVMYRRSCMGADVLGVGS